MFCQLAPLLLLLLLLPRPALPRRRCQVLLLLLLQTSLAANAAESARSRWHATMAPEPAGR
jgi:hypothetical protein